MHVHKTYICCGCPTHPAVHLRRLPQSLTMPTTAAIIECCNKAYAVVKTKTLNGLSPGRASTLAMVSYNLKMHRSSSAPTSCSDKRIKRNNIMAMTVPFACTQPSEPPLPDFTPLAQQLDDDDDDNAVIDEQHGESDAGEDANDTNSESDADTDDSGSSTDMEDNVASMPVSVKVAVKVFDKLQSWLVILSEQLEQVKDLSCMWSHLVTLTVKGGLTLL